MTRNSLCRRLGYIFPKIDEVNDQEYHIRNIRHHFLGELDNEVFYPFDSELKTLKFISDKFVDCPYQVIDKIFITFVR